MGRRKLVEDDELLAVARESSSRRESLRPRGKSPIERAYPKRSSSSGTRPRRTSSSPRCSLRR